MRPDARAAEKRYYEPDNGERLDAVGGHILALLAEAPDELADRVAACGRRPPASGEGWHGWTRLSPRLYARAGLPGTRNHCTHLAQWACWRLFRRGAVEVATTPMAGSRGRLRWVRLAPPASPAATPAHPWSLPGVHAGASRA